MEKPSPIVMVAISDDDYSILLTAMLKSVELNHGTEEDIIVYIIEDGITSNSKRKLLDSLNLNIFQINWVNIADTIPVDAQLPLDNSTYPLSIYAKLFIPYILPLHIKRVIFLDVDMIVLNDISKLWYLDLGDNIIGAVQDHYIKYIEAWDGIKNYKELGFENGRKYFNAGLLIIDLEKWRSLEIAKEVIACITQNIKFANFPEQYGMNVVLYDKWYEIDPLWNFFASYDHKNPYNIHFIGRKPIYQSYSNNERFRDIFYGYLNKTAWVGFKPKFTIKSKVKKVRNKIKKFSLKSIWA